MSSQCILRLFSLFILVLLVGCSNKPSLQTTTMHPAEVKASIVKLMPVKVSNKPAWAGDIYTALHTQKLEPTVSNLCAVIAVADQESSFNADPSVPGLPAIAWKEIDQRAAQLHIPAFLVRTALMIPSPTGKSYRERLDNVRTEKDLSAIFDDFINMVPLGQRLFGRLNPIHTGGAMQVSIAFAEAHARDYPYPVNGSIRREVFSRRGGIYFGVMHLLGYPANYSQPLYRFADFNAGWYASRNAAFQAAVMRVSGVSLALDGDLIRYDSDQAGATEQAVKTLAARLNMSAGALRRDLEKGATIDFEQTDLYQRLFTLADRVAGKRLSREVLPGIKLASPKITRNLTTAWFAARVNDRYQRCLARQ